MLINLNSSWLLLWLQENIDNIVYLYIMEITLLGILMKTDYCYYVNTDKFKIVLCCVHHLVCASDFLLKPLPPEGTKTFFGCWIMARDVEMCQIILRSLKDETVFKRSVIFNISFVKVERSQHFLKVKVRGKLSWFFNLWVKFWYFQYLITKRFWVVYQQLYVSQKN